MWCHPSVWKPQHCFRWTIPLTYSLWQFHRKRCKAWCPFLITRTNHYYTSIDKSLSPYIVTFSGIQNNRTQLQHKRKLWGFAHSQLIFWIMSFQQQQTQQQPHPQSPMYPLPQPQLGVMNQLKEQLEERTRILQADIKTQQQELHDIKEKLHLANLQVTLRQKQSKYEIRYCIDVIMY